MIESIQISNFKSIREISFDCKKINVLIGEPNSGKSNILEGLGLISSLNYENLRSFVRFDNLVNLFNDLNIDEPLTIKCDDLTLGLRYLRDFFYSYTFYRDSSLKINFYKYDYYGNKISLDQDEIISRRLSPSRIDEIYKEFKLKSENIKYYNYINIEKFNDRTLQYLLPPNGENMSSIIITNERLKEVINNIFEKFDYRFVIEEPERTIKTLREEANVLLLFPYNLVSDTLRRLVFYLSAICSNENSTLIFNEPETNAFPYYTKYLAEKIALDNNNQYFISTHNPYFLRSILEKTSKNDIAIFVTYVENYNTKIKELENEEMISILDYSFDPFFNITTYIE